MPALARPVASSAPPVITMPISIPPADRINNACRDATLIRGSGGYTSHQEYR
jgi:hypothetical protein